MDEQERSVVQTKQSELLVDNDASFFNTIARKKYLVSNDND